jgi:PEGA domain-containing protein
MGEKKGGSDLQRQRGQMLPPVAGPRDGALPDPVVGRNGVYQTGTVPASPLALGAAGQGAPGPGAAGQIPPGYGANIALGGPKSRPHTMIGIAPPAPGSVTPPSVHEPRLPSQPLPEPTSSQRLTAAPPVPLASASGDVVTRLNPIVAPQQQQARALLNNPPRRNVTPAPPQAAPLPPAPLPPTPLPPLAGPAIKPPNGQAPVPLDWDDDVKTTVYDRQAQEEVSRLKNLKSAPPPPMGATPLAPPAVAAMPALGAPPAVGTPGPGRVVIPEHARAPHEAPPGLRAATPAPGRVQPTPAPLMVPFGPPPGAVLPPSARTGHAMPSMARLASNNDPTQLSRAKSRTKTLATVGVGLLAALVLGSLVLLARVYLVPHTSKLVVNAKGDGRHLEKALVFVDGKPVACDVLPCRIGNVAAGARSVRVVAEGYDENTEVVEAEEKKEKPVTVELRRSTSASTGFRIRGSSAVRLFVDNREYGTLPQEVRDLAPGDHQLKLVSSNLYKAEDRTITVVENQISDLGNVALKVLRGRATITLGQNAQGAKVTLVSDGDRRTVARFPIVVEVETSKQWTLEVSKPGYEDFSQALRFDDGEAERSFIIDLQEKGGAHPTPAAPPPAAPAAPRAAAPSPAAAPPENDAPKGGSSGAVGFLNLNSIPPSTCIVDGKTIGMTPRSSLPLSPGSHSVVFTHPDHGSKTVSVTLGAGETKSAAVRFP